MQKYQNSIQDLKGNAVAGASIAVYIFGTASLATIYSDNGVTVIAPGALLSDAEGEFAFYAANGRYNVQVVATGLASQTTYDVLLFDPADADITSVKNFGAVGDGVTDDTAAIQAAFSYSAQNNALVTLVDGESYRLTGTVSVTGGLRVKGKATFLSPANTEGVKVEPARSVSTAVSAISLVQYPASTGIESGSSQLTVASAAGFSIGDICQVRSADTYSFDATANKGELVQISGISGTTINLAAPLVNSFSTTIVFEKLNSAVVDINGPVFSYDGDWLAAGAHTRFSALALIGCVNPQVTATFANDISVGLLLVSCWQAKVDAVCYNLRNSESPIQFLGYGVAAYGSTRAGDIKVDARNVRHAYTDGLYPIGSSPIRSGCALDMMIRDGLAVNCTFAAWDTHPGSINTQFVNCGAVVETTNVDQPSRFNSQGFQDRGLNTTFHNCWSVGVRNPFAFEAGKTTYGATNTTKVVGGYFERRITTATGFSATVTVTGSDVFRIQVSNAVIVGYLPAQNTPAVNTHEFYNCRFVGDATANGLNLSNNIGGLTFYDCTFVDWTLMRMGQTNNHVLLGCKRINSSSAEALTVGVSSTATIHNYYAEASSYGSSQLIKAGAASDAGTVTINLGSVYAKAFTAQPVVTNGTATLTLNSLARQQPTATKSTTANRPALLPENIGYMYLDTTLDADGKPIWWNGSAWIDATGATV